MPLPGPEIRDRAIAFSRDWQDAESERAEAQAFWNEFFAVFGVPRRRVASFEEPVKKLGAKKGRVRCCARRPGFPPIRREIDRAQKRAGKGLHDPSECLIQSREMRCRPAQGSKSSSISIIRIISLAGSGP